MTGEMAIIWHRTSFCPRPTWRDGGPKRIFNRLSHSLCVLTRTARFIWLLVGLLALALGALGIALPLLPTTPFILVAAVAFARSSKRLHFWLVNHPVFGALIDNWQRYGAISRRAKVLSVVSMIALPVISLAMAAPGAVIVVQVLVLGMAAAFVLTRPEPPGQ